MKNLKNIQLTSLVLSIVLGGLGIINALLNWIAFVQSEVVAPFTYVLNSILVAAACVTLIVLGLVFLMRDEQLNVLTVTFLLIASACCSMLIGGLFAAGPQATQLLLAIANIGLLIWYLVSANLENTFAKKTETKKKEPAKTSKSKNDEE